MRRYASENRRPQKNPADNLANHARPAKLARQPAARQSDEQHYGHLHKEKDHGMPFAAGARNERPLFLFIRGSPGLPGTSGRIAMVNASRSMSAPGPSGLKDVERRCDRLRRAFRKAAAQIPPRLPNPIRCEEQLPGGDRSRYAIMSPRGQPH